jgi:hypothetical protein
MDELDKLIEKKYQKRNSDHFGFQNLLELVEGVLGKEYLTERESRSPSTEKEAPEQGGYFLPTIKITEAWGKPGTKDREIIEQFTRKIPGATLEEKLGNINAVIRDADPAAKVPQVLSSMVMIEVLNSILGEFTESAGGFIFEGFLAGLFGGQSVQITDVGQQEQETSATGKPITDVVLGDREYSLKLLGPSTGVKGSFKNMVEHFKGRDHIVYLDARRTAEGLEFGEFVITLGDFAKVFIDPLVKQVTKKGEEAFRTDDASELKKFISKLIKEKRSLKRIKLGEKGFIEGRADTVFQYSPAAKNLSEAKLNEKDMNAFIGKLMKTDNDELQRFSPFIVDYADTKFEGTKAERLFGTFGKAEQVRRLSQQGKYDELLRALEDTPGYKNREQFEFTRSQAESIESFKPIGELEINPDALKRTWMAYGDVLKQNVEPIYKALNQFNENINKFFLSDDDEGSHKQHGVEAASDAKQLKTSTDEAVQSFK